MPAWARYFYGKEMMNLESIVVQNILSLGNSIVNGTTSNTRRAMFTLSNVKRELAPKAAEVVHVTPSVTGR